jgi:hypothetical protein
MDRKSTGKNILFPILDRGLLVGNLPGGFNKGPRKNNLVNFGPRHKLDAQARARVFPRWRFGLVW